MPSMLNTGPEMQQILNELPLKMENSPCAVKSPADGFFDSPGFKSTDL